MSNKLKRNRRQDESLPAAMRQFFGFLLDGFICIYMLLIIVVMPLYFEEGFTRIGTNKAMFFRNVSVSGAWFIIPTAALYLIFLGIENAQRYPKTQKRRRRHLTVTDKFALLYGASLILSYLCSDYKDMALWGADGWFMGLLPQLIFLGIYFCVSRFWKKRTGMFILMLTVSAVVFALGYLNRFGIYPIDMEVENPLFLSTIGNINWYCGYLVSVFFGGCYLLLQQEEEQKEGMQNNRIPIQWIGKLLLMAYVGIGFATLVTQGSVSGLVTLTVMLIVMFCLSVGDGKKMVLFWQEVLILSLVCLATWCLRRVCNWEATFEDSFVNLLTYSIFPVMMTMVSLIFVVGISYCNAHNRYPAKVFRGLKWIVAGGAIAGVCIFIGMITLNTLRPGSIGNLSDNALFTFSPTWGSNRGATWKAGMMCFVEQNVLHKMVGVGPDAMEGFLSGGASGELIALVRERFGTDRLTNAHCEWLTILVNEGLLGFVGFGGMIVSAIARFIKSGRQNIILGACGFCLLAYTVNNMFSFQQSMSVATIFVILGIGEAYARAYASGCL